MRVQIDFSDSPSRTKQAFKDESDVNNIMKKWRRTGEMTHLNTREPTYGDFTSGDDFMTAQQSVIDAKADFDSLSARIRDRMGNSPATLLRFMADPENLEEAISLGLLNKPAEEPLAEAAIAAEPPSPAAAVVPDGSISGGE